MADTPETLQELWDACDAHDWYYHMSDDQRVWKQGLNRYKELLMAAAEIEGGDDLILKFLSGLHETPNKKPERPDA